MAIDNNHNSHSHQAADQFTLDQQSEFLTGLFAWKSVELPPHISTVLIKLTNKLMVDSNHLKVSQQVEQQLQNQDFLELQKFAKQLIATANLVDNLFDYFSLQAKLSSSFLNSIVKLPITFFKISIINPNFLVESNHIGQTLLNNLVMLGASLSSKSQLLKEINQVIQYLVDGTKNANQPEQINERLQATLSQLSNLIDTINKRAQIFEKRTREIAEGKAKTDITKAWASEQLMQITQAFNLPSFVLLFINEVWRHVVFLEKLKSSTEKNLETLSLAKSLIICLQVVDNKAAKTKLENCQEKTLIEIKPFLEKTNLSENDAAAFITKLTTYFQKTKIQSDDLIIENSKEKIIRLKPKDFANFETNSEEDTQSLNIDNLSDQEWVEFVFNQTDSQYQTKQTNHSQKPTQSKSKSLINWNTGDWFDIKVNKQTVRSRLSAYIEETQHYVFLDFSRA